MADLRVHSFLGRRALPHYVAAGALVAAACGLEAEPCSEPGLAHLAETLAAPGPALLFLCGLPYVRSRDAGAAIEPLAGALPHGETGPSTTRRSSPAPASGRARPTSSSACGSG